jgi:hypothetical protein
LDDMEMGKRSYGKIWEKPPETMDGKRIRLI